jgi:hypothetical protein
MITIERRGVTRIVILTNRYAIKIPKPKIWNHFLRGILANISEKRTWRWNSGEYEEGFSHLLCPVVWCSWGGWILVMERARPLSRADWEWVTVPEHKKHFPGDDTMSNYGWMEGRVVKIDYGELDVALSGFAPKASKG